MTKKEAAIISVFTGVLVGDFEEFQKYAEKVLGRSIMTHELRSEIIWEKLRVESLDDFCGIRIGEEQNILTDERKSVAALIENMRAKGADIAELYNATAHSLNVFDAENAYLRFKRSTIDNEIEILKEKYKD